MKRCTKCLTNKPLAGFRVRSDRPCGRTSECNECLTARDKARYRRKRDDILAVSASWRDKNRDKLSADQRARYAADVEGHRAAARARYRANPEPYKDRAIVRAAQLAGGHVRRAYITERDGGRCHICGGKVAPKDRSIDHLIPLSRGGEHSEANVRLAHLSCNIRRGADRLPAQLLLVA